MSQVIDNTLQTLQTASGFQFSMTGLDDLDDFEYTLVTIVVDISSSVSGYKKQLEDCIKTVVKSCQDAPRSENLLVRVITFNQNITEVHGFRVLSTIDVDEYDNSLNPRGCTALFEATQSAIEATYEYGRTLSDQDYFANGVVYVITDGESNSGGHSPSSIKDLVGQIQRDEESLESLAVILIGVGYANVSSYLDTFKDQAELDQFVDMTQLFNEASPEKALAKLAGYISRSISTTSMALQGGNSTPASSILLF